MNSVLQQVRRHAHPRLDRGGTATPASKDAKKPTPPLEDFVLPKDVEPAELLAAMESKVRDSLGSQEVLERRAGGRVVVPVAHLLRLGGGDVPKGRRYLQGLVWDLRRQRMRRK